MLPTAIILSVNMLDSSLGYGIIVCQLGGGLAVPCSRHAKAGRIPSPRGEVPSRAGQKVALKSRPCAVVKL